jgi:hypothetical protein
MEKRKLKTAVFSRRTALYAALVFILAWEFSALYPPVPVEGYDVLEPLELDIMAENRPDKDLYHFKELFDVRPGRYIFTAWLMRVSGLRAASASTVLCLTSLAAFMVLLPLFIKRFTGAPVWAALAVVAASPLIVISCYSYASQTMQIGFPAGAFLLLTLAGEEEKTSKRLILLGGGGLALSLAVFIRLDAAMAAVSCLPLLLRRGRMRRGVVDYALLGALVLALSAVLYHLAGLNLYSVLSEAHLANVVPWSVFFPRFADFYGLPGLLLLGVGVLSALSGLRRGWQDRPCNILCMALLSVTACFAAYRGNFGSPRHLLPYATGIFPLAAYGLHSLISRISAPPRWKAPVALACAVAVLVLMLSRPMVRHYWEAHLDFTSGPLRSVGFIKSMKQDAQRSARRLEEFLDTLKAGASDRTIALISTPWSTWPVIVVYLSREFVRLAPSAPPRVEGCAAYMSDHFYYAPKRLHLHLLYADSWNACPEYRKFPKFICDAVRKPAYLLADPRVKGALLADNPALADKIVFSDPWTAAGWDDVVIFDFSDFAENGK